jgi:hypothetical protein
MEAEVDLRTIGGSLCPPKGSSRKPLRHNSDWILFSTLSQPFKIGPLCGIIGPIPHGSCRCHGCAVVVKAR